MLKSPGLVKDRATAAKSAAGNMIFNWLMERKGLTEEGAMAMATRMVQLDILIPLVGAPGGGTFSSDKSALYRVVLMNTSKQQQQPTS